VIQRGLNHALTAFYCIKSNEPGEDLELSFATGERLPGRVCDHARGADLALIDVLKPHESTLITPSADRWLERNTCHHLRERPASGGFSAMRAVLLCPEVCHLVALWTVRIAR
jgi:hypothetical protein